MVAERWETISHKMEEVVVARWEMISHKMEAVVVAARVQKVPLLQGFQTEGKSHQEGEVVGRGVMVGKGSSLKLPWKHQVCHPSADQPGCLVYEVMDYSGHFHGKSSSLTVLGS